MPCRDYDDTPGYNRMMMDRMQQRLDAATRVACEVLRKIESNDTIELTSLGLSKKTKKWWAEHQEEDRRRLAAEEKDRLREEARKAGLAKLTQEEREALGVR